MGFIHILSDRAHFVHRTTPSFGEKDYLGWVIDVLFTLMRRRIKISLTAISRNKVVNST
jgi:hypothetical protein